MKISSVNEDVIWHKWRKFYEVSLLHAKMIRVWFQKMLFLSEHAAVYFLSVKILFANTKKTEYQFTEYQLNNNVTITSFCFVNKSTAEGHPGTEVNACGNLGRVTTWCHLQSRISGSVCELVLSVISYKIYSALANFVIKCNQRRDQTRC